MTHRRAAPAAGPHRSRAAQLAALDRVRRDLAHLGADVRHGARGCPPR